MSLQIRGANGLLRTKILRRRQDKNQNEDEQCDSLYLKQFLR